MTPGVREYQWPAKYRWRRMKIMDSLPARNEYWTGLESLKVHIMNVSGGVGVANHSGIILVALPH